MCERILVDRGDDRVVTDHDHSVEHHRELVARVLVIATRLDGIARCLLVGCVTLSPLNAASARSKKRVDTSRRSVHPCGSACSAYRVQIQTTKVNPFCLFFLFYFFFFSLFFFPYNIFHFNNVVLVVCGILQRKQ